MGNFSKSTLWSPNSQTFGNKPGINGCLTLMDSFGQRVYPSLLYRMNGCQVWRKSVDQQ